jgi:N-acetylglucosaminyldiphosphoundecaprenol N-acetyl-beta-D-mannosaminyltransferase
MQPVELLGIKLTGTTIDELNQIIRNTIADQKKGILANHNLHSLYLFHHDEKLREFFSRTLLTQIDGMSLIVLARIFGYKLTRDQRVTYVDWIGPLMKEASEQGWKVFFIGSRSGVGEKAAKILTYKYKGLNIKVHHGFFDNKSSSAANAEILALINSFCPNILMVGMGMPRQEYWIHDNIDKINANIILPSGACMDYVAGTIPTAPRWMGKMGLEWLFRLFSEPHRLWRRYLIEPLFICRLLTKEIFFRKCKRMV